MSKDYSNIEGLIGNVKESIRNAYDKGYKQGFNDGNCNKEFYCNLNFEHGTHKGLDDVWELVRKLRHPSYEGTYSDDEKRDIFGYVSADSILTHLSASEAIQKVKEYEEKQKADSNKVTRQSIIKSQLMDIVNGQENPVTADEIAEVLEQLKEGQDETK